MYECTCFFKKLMHFSYPEFHLHMSIINIFCCTYNSINLYLMNIIFILGTSPSVIYTLCKLKEQMCHLCDLFNTEIFNHNPFFHVWDHDTRVTITIKMCLYYKLVVILLF